MYLLLISYNTLLIEVQDTLGFCGMTIYKNIIIYISHTYYFLTCIPTHTYTQLKHRQHTTV